MIGVYKITNPSGKIYIGSTNNFKRRISEYKYKTCKDQVRLYNSLKKYGFNNHNILLIEKCSLENLYNRERYWQEYYNVIDRDKGLNCQYVNTNIKPKKVSEETKLKISKAMSGKNNPRYGVKLSQEIKDKISKSNKGKRQSKKLNALQSKRMMGNNYSKLSKKIIDLKTNIIYKSIRQASIEMNVNYNTLKKYLSGSLKNKTTLKYL